MSNSELENLNTDESITVDNVVYQINDLPQEIQLVIRQYVICQTRIKEETEKFNPIYDKFMIERSILDAAIAQYEMTISEAVRGLATKSKE